MFSGSITALVTPFRDGRIHERAYTALINWQIAQGTHGLVPCGTTGEAPTLTVAERERLIRLCVKAASGRVPVIAGTGTNCTATTIAMTQAAKRAGADAALVVTPYYNRPSQEGLYQHFAALARAVSLPLILYNVPSRTGVDLLPVTVARLTEFDNIVGIKDATGDLRRPGATAALAGHAFVQLSGDDRTALDFNAAGGQGCISVVSNVAPGLCAAMQQAWRRGDKDAARALRDHLAPLINALALETNPGPVKYALSLVRRGMSPELRLPLTPIGPATALAVRHALDRVMGQPRRAA